MADRWLILRCSNCKTLDLAASLTDAGFEAWSPVETVQRRARKGNKPEAVRLALTPSYVFAQAHHLYALLELSRSPALNYRVWDSEKRKMVTRGHPYFRLFRHLGEIATIPATHLTALRNLERKRAPKPVAKAMKVGARVRLSESGFEGLWATVQSSRKNYTRVLIDDWIVPVDFPTWTLQQGYCNDGPVKVMGHQSEQALIAKAA